MGQFVSVLMVPLRGIHEVIWALILVNILGLDPMVAVLAIGVPFAAVSARVFAELFSAQPRAPFDSLISLGARPTTAFAYGVLPAAARDCRFIMVEETGTGPEHPLSGEKLSLVLAIYRARDFRQAKAIVADILDYQGRGHSCGIHTRNLDHARELAADLDVVRVLVNQAHTFGNGGGFDNGLPFTLSMGCGTWQANAISDNLNWRCFVNITHLVTTIPEDKPSEEALFGAYWKKYGK